MNARRTLLCFGFLALFAGQSFHLPVSAQSPACPPSQADQQVKRRDTKVIVDQVEFQGENPLTDSERAKLASEIQQHDVSIAPGGQDYGWADEATQVLIRGALQDKGYFRILVQGTPYLIRAADHELHFALRVEIDSGPQYRLGNVSFQSADKTPLDMSETLLRQQLELDAGDLFNTSKIRAAIDNVSRLYTSRGYIDTTIEPQLSIQDDPSKIDMVMVVDKQQRYRIGDIAILGLPNATAAALRMPQAIGDYVDPTLWRDFFKANVERLPKDASAEENMLWLRNTREATVAITLNFQACLEPPPAHSDGIVLRTKTEH